MDRDTPYVIEVPLGVASFPFRFFEFIVKNVFRNINFLMIRSVELRKLVDNLWAEARIRMESNYSAKIWEIFDSVISK